MAPPAVDRMPFDERERLGLCATLAEVGGRAPTLLPGWTAADIAAHLILRERDPIAGPCMVLPGGFQREAQRRVSRLADGNDLAWLIERLRSGPPPGFFRIGWVRSFASLNEFFVHHEDIRRANGLGPRNELSLDMELALWRNVRRGARFLSRRLHQGGLVVEWAGTPNAITVRRGEPLVRLVGPPGELLLHLFGRVEASVVEMAGPADGLARLRDTRFGM